MNIAETRIGSPAPAARQTVNYTIVALIGMIAGFIVGFLFGHGDGKPTSGNSTTVHSLQ